MKKRLLGLLPRTKKEWLYVFVAIIGVAMIIFSNAVDHLGTHEADKVLPIIGDLGIGFFPTGIIGLILDRMNSQEKNIKKNNIRNWMLLNIDVSVHSYFNLLCNSAIEADVNLKGKGLFEILKWIEGQRVISVNSNTEMELLDKLVMEMKNSFSQPSPIFAVYDIFSQNEEKYFALLIEKGEKLLKSKGGMPNIVGLRNDFLSYLTITCRELPELQHYQRMISDGDNIAIPNC